MESVGFEGYAFGGTWSTGSRKGRAYPTNLRHSNPVGVETAYGEVMGLLDGLRRLVTPKEWEPPKDLQEARQRLEEVQRRLDISAEELDIILLGRGKIQ